MVQTAKEKASADVETELIAKAKNGDKEAFNRIIELHQNEIYRLAYRMLDDRDDALDIVQETFFRARAGWHRWHKTRRRCNAICFAERTDAKFAHGD